MLRSAPPSSTVSVYAISRTADGLAARLVVELLEGGDSLVPAEIRLRPAPGALGETPATGRVEQELRRAPRRSRPRRLRRAGARPAAPRRPPPRAASPRAPSRRPAPRAPSPACCRRSGSARRRPPLDRCRASRREPSRGRTPRPPASARISSPGSWPTSSSRASGTRCSDAREDRAGEPAGGVHVRRMRRSCRRRGRSAVPEPSGSSGRSGTSTASGILVTGVWPALARTAARSRSAKTTIASNRGRVLRS